MSMAQTMKPIGHIQTLFKFKNGTPRQAGVCQNARGTLTIDKSIFNNPEHSLEGLEEFSHAWIIFVFHKNNNSYVKAKVRPPRLDGRRIGLFSTRAPYRPNPIGLTLAKIERISGASIYFSGIDLLDGTPVLDVKPYILQYDCPSSGDHPEELPEENQLKSSHSSTVFTNSVDTICTNQQPLTMDLDNVNSKVLIDRICNTNGGESVGLPLTKDNTSDTAVTDNELLAVDNHRETKTEIDTVVSPAVVSRSTKIDVTDSALQATKHIQSNETAVTKRILQCTGSYTAGGAMTSTTLQASDSYMEKQVLTNIISQITDESGEVLTKSQLPGSDSDSLSTVPAVTANWVMKAPVAKLSVLFTERAKHQLQIFSNQCQQPDFRLRFLHGPGEVQEAIHDILAEDPRSVYRRNVCKDNLYYFVVDAVHITCWFFDSFVEVLRIQPASYVVQTKDVFS